MAGQNKDGLFDLVLKDGVAVLPGRTVQADIAVRGGKIIDIGRFDERSAARSISCKNLHILPGVIDTQVHFREPGGEHKEDLAHGTRAAAMGGVTAVFEMPNTSPLTTTPEALADKMQRAEKSAMTDYAFYLGGTAENAEHLAQWENLPGVCGIKIFMGASTGDLLSASDEDVLAVLQNGRRIVAVHAEDEYIMQDNKGKILGNSQDVRLHPVWRSPESCLSATKRLINLARKVGRRVHVLHITTAEEIEFLAQNKDIATVEVLPNHLSLYAPDCYESLGAKAQQNPPIREKHHQEALWAGIANGVVDMIGSDHAAHTLAEKAQPYPQSPSGTPGVQTMVPVMLDHVHHGRLTLERFVDLVCYGPQRIHQIAAKGRIAAGYDADFTIVDLKAKRTITNSQQQSKCGWTPFDGMEVTGWPMMTVIRGQVVMQEDELRYDRPVGMPIVFRETLGPS